MTVKLKAQFDAFISEELRRIESRFTVLSEEIAENARNIPEDWNDCEDCENAVLDGYDAAYGFLCREFHEAIKNHL